MPTKDELIAFASEVGVDVSSSATKAEIESAIYDAGYDPMTLEADPVSEPETAAGDDAPDPTEVGYAGVVPDEIENDAYTVSGQGAETARRQREQLQALKAQQYTDSGEGDA